MAADPIATTLIYLPLTGFLALGIRVLYRADKLITTIERLLRNHPPHTHNPDGSTTYDPDYPPPITVGAHK